MAGLCMDYCLFVSIAGVILLFFLSLCCFIGMEALHLPTGKKNQRGIEVLVATIVSIF